MYNVQYTLHTVIPITLHTAEVQMIAAITSIRTRLADQQLFVWDTPSRLGKMINNDNRKKNDEDNVKNQLKRSHKRMKTYKQSEDIQIQTYI